jgi:hypothetical protein
MGADSTVLALKFLETENGRQKFTSRMHPFGNNRLAQKSVDYHRAPHPFTVKQVWFDEMLKAAVPFFKRTLKKEK